MRKTILIVLLAAISGNAAAEWVEVASDASTTTIYATIYADPASIRKAGNVVKMWDLKDYRTAREIVKGMPYMSTKGQHEYDCKEEQYRSLATSFHSGNMGKGGLVSSLSKPSMWGPVPPDSPIEFLWKFACGKQ